MPEKRLDLILKVSLTESTNSWDGTLRGAFDATVYGDKPTAKYDDHPFDYLVPYESRWARFVRLGTRRMAVWAWQRARVLR